MQDQFDQRTVVVAAYPLEAEIACGGLLLAHSPSNPPTIVVMVERLLPGRRLPPDRAEETTANSAKQFGCRLTTLGFSEQTVRDDPVAAIRLAQILREADVQLVITHHRLDANPDHAGTFAIAYRAIVLAQAGGTLVDGPPLPERPQLWTFDADGNGEIAVPANGPGRAKYELLGNGNFPGDGGAGPAQSARQRDAANGGVERFQPQVVA